MFKFSRTLIQVTCRQALEQSIFNNNAKSSFSTASACLAKMEIDGLKLNWQKWGTGPNVALCLPGLVGSISGNFAPIVKKMNLEKFTLIAWDPPGYGRSRPPNRDVFIDDFVLNVDARLAAKLMENLGYDHYSLIGWSNGGITGALLVCDFPERVNKLVICNSPSGYSAHLRKIMSVMTDLDYWSPTQRKALLRDYEKPYVEKMLKDWKKVNDDRGDKAFKGKMANVLPTVSTPVLYIRGEKDMVVLKADSEDYASWISNFRIHTVPGGGHDHLEFVDEFVSATESFLLDS